MEILLSTIAVFYITSMITEYDGPFSLFEKLRELSREYRGFNLDCFFCTSLWISLPFALYLTSGINVVVYWFALAGGAVVINEVFGNE